MRPLRCAPGTTARVCFMYALWHCIRFHFAAVLRIWKCFISRAASTLRRTSEDHGVYLEPVQASAVHQVHQATEYFIMKFLTWPFGPSRSLWTFQRRVVIWEIVFVPSIRSLKLRLSVIHFLCNNMLCIYVSLCTKGNNWGVGWWLYNEELRMYTKSLIFWKINRKKTRQDKRSSEARILSVELTR
jgi:hypothetical protein